LGELLHKDRIILAFLGTMYFHTIDPLFKAFEQLSTKIRNRLLFLQIGWKDSRDSKKVKLLMDMGVAEFKTRIEKEKALSIMVQADILILLINNEPKWYHASPGKLYEYLYSGRPILAIAPDGAAAKLLRESGAGCVVHPEDIDDLSNILEQIALDYKNFVDTYYHPRWEIIKRYDRRELTNRLANVFDSIIVAPVSLI
jgi:glycosyltransferase involved in cell wall biosynthesis